MTDGVGTTATTLPKSAEMRPATATATAMGTATGTGTATGLLQTQSTQT